KSGGLCTGRESERPGAGCSFHQHKRRGYDMSDTNPVYGAASQDDRTVAMLTHLSGIILGFIVALVVWLINKDKPERGFLISQSKEALNFQITLLFGYIIGMVLSIILIGRSEEHTSELQ